MNTGKLRGSVFRIRRGIERWVEVTFGDFYWSEEVSSLRDSFLFPDLPSADALG